MSLLHDEMDPEVAAKQAQKRVTWLSFVAVGLVHLLLISSMWGRWGHIALVTGVFLMVTAINILVLSQRPFADRARTVENVRVGLNFVSTLLYGHFSGWALPAWLYLPLNSVWLDSYVDNTVRPRLFLLLALVGGVALVEGSPPLVPVCFILLSLITFFIAEARVFTTQQALRNLDRQHRELARALAELELAHQRAREQDRLTSLGILAAGVAHEVNNPMSFVKSNVHSLLQDLRSMRDLPPVLREYVEDVLPATLDGIQRVNTIVADLRRFSRGDHEAMVEYDLNEELRTALRIVRTQLEPRCTVVLEQGKLEALVGRPRQITQVAVNLLVNAAQAMPEGGKVFITTRMEGDEALLTVRDTGVGMSPEVRAQLFQPFFTTKPVGEGTGMGLAVVHGIVTAHGGRIQVESQLQQGSTFTLWLPRTPAVKAEDASPLHAAGSTPS